MFGNGVRAIMDDEMIAMTNEGKEVGPGNSVLAPEVDTNNGNL